MFTRGMVAEALYRLARLSIALRHYEFDHGGLPENLDALAPMYIDQVPLDPLGDGPMKMETVEGAVRVYSVGVKPPAVENEQKAEIFLKVHT
jgi:hypothetical protein